MEKGQWVKNLYVDGLVTFIFVGIGTASLLFPFEKEIIWMKKRRILLVIIVFLGLGITWVIEPLSFNPFGQVDIPKAHSEVRFTCDDSIFVGRAQLEEQANKIINDRIIAHDFLGVSAGLYLGEGGTYVSGAGFMNKGNQKRANSDMLSRIASISKPMTAIAVMQLYEKGLIDLDSPIQTYLQDFPQKAAGDISIRQLLKHTSGIPHYASKWEAMSFTNYATLSEAVAVIQKKELAFKPGTQYQYSSYGYTILGAIIEKVTQMSYAEYMKQNIWDKAGMLDTSLENKEPSINRSGLYLKVSNYFIKSPHTDLSIIYPGGGVQSTVKDLLKFGAAILNNTLIKRATLEMMINAADELAPAIGDDPYGFGWAIYDDPKQGLIIQHGGTQPGTSSFLAIYLEQKMVSAVLSNSFGSRQNAFALSRDLVRLTK